MPTYEYRCPEGHAFELFQKISEKPRAKCPVCGRTAVRQISAGAGLHFKGSGFYITDYGKDGKGPRKAADKPAETASSDKPAAETSPAPATDKPAGDKPPTAKPHSRKAKE